MHSGAGRSPAKVHVAPKNRSSHMLPWTCSIRCPANTSRHSRPATRAAAAVIRQWFDCGAPSVTRTSAPRRAERHQDVRAEARRIGNQVLELARLVASECEARVVVTLDQESVQAYGRRQARRLLKRRGQGGELESRKSAEAGFHVSQGPAQPSFRSLRGQTACSPWPARA